MRCRQCLERGDAVVKPTGKRLTRLARLTNHRQLCDPVELRTVGHSREGRLGGKRGRDTTPGFDEVELGERRQEQDEQPGSGPKGEVAGELLESPQVSSRDRNRRSTSGELSEQTL